MTLKKRFDSEQEALAQSQAVLRAGFDSYTRGRVCTIIVEWCGEAVLAFGSGWRKV